MASAFDYSTTAGSNSAVGGVSVAEGMSPAGLNDAIRAFMADIAKLLADQGGAIVTTGSANAYLFTTNSTITAYADKQRFHIVANHTCTGASTANGDSVGAKKLRKITSAGEVALAANDIMADGHYIIEYDASADAAAGALIVLNPTISAYAAGGTDVALADGGTGASLVDPAADRMLFWDDSETTVAFLAPSTGLAITTANLAVDKASDANVYAAASNKVLTSDLIETASAFVTLTDAATIALDNDTGVNFTVTLGGNRTLGNPTNGQPGTWRMIRIIQDATGSRTLAYGNQYHFAGGTEPTLTTAANAIDVLMLWCVTSSLFYGFISKDHKA